MNGLRALLRMYGPAVAALLITYLLFKYVLVFVLPFVLAVLLALILEPWVKMLQRRLRMSRGLAVGLVLVLSIVILTAIFLIGVTSLVVEVALFQQRIPDFYLQARKSLGLVVEQFGRWQESLPIEVQTLLQQQQIQWLDEGRAWLELNTGHWLATLQRVALVDIPNILVVLAVTGIATFFVSKDKDTVRQAALNLMPKPWRRAAGDVLHSLLGSAVGFTNALAVLVLATTLATILGLGILGSPYAILIGIVSGILDIIPVIGPGLIFVPWIIYNLVFGSLGYGLMLALLYGTIAGLRALLQAQVIGERIGIHPLTTLIALYVGARLLGPIGFVVGPLVVVLLKAMTDARIIATEP